MKKEYRYQVSPLFISKAQKTKANGVQYYKQAMSEGVLPTDYSKILHHGTPLKKDDWRVIAIGKLFGLSPGQCFVRVELKK